MQISAELPASTVPANAQAAWSAPAQPATTPSSSAPAPKFPSSEFKNPFGAPSETVAAPSEPVPAAGEKQLPAEPIAPSLDAKPVAETEVELPVEKDLCELVKEPEEDEDDEPDFKMEFDLELPAAFNKPVEQLRKEEEEKKELQRLEKAKEEEEKEEVSALPPAAETTPDRPMQKPVGVPISMPISVPVETARPGQVAGFGKGTKITLKADYAPSDTGRLFAITPSEALTLLAEDEADTCDEKKDGTSSKGKKGKNKASQSQTKLAKQQTKGKKGQAGKSQTGLQSIKEAEPSAAWMPQKNQTHPAAFFGKKGGASNVPDFIEDLVPAVQTNVDLNIPIGELKTVGPSGKPTSTQSKMASIKQRAVSLSVSNLLPVPLEIAEAQAELAYIVEHRGTPAVPPVTYTPPPPLPPPSQSDATIVELLTMSGFFSKKDIAAALEKALEDSSMAPDLLMALGLVNDETLDVVVRCQGLTRSRYLTNEQAIYVLGAVRSGRLSFEDALVEIGK